MKNIFQFILPVFLLLSVEVKSQTYSYHSFPDSNVIWNGFESCGSQGYSYRNYWSDSVTMDTVFNGNLYHKIGSIGFVREDSLKRVYLYSNKDTPTYEKLLYDFSLTVGDTFFSKQNFYVVDSIVMMEYHGVLRKTFYLSYLNNLGQDNDVWIEGIGSFKGPLGIWKLMSPFFCYYPIMCQAFYNSELIYQRKAGSGGCGIYSSIIQSDILTAVTLSPNPTSSSFTLQLATAPSTETYFTLYDAMGRLVRKEEINSSNTTILRNNLPSGIYFWQLESVNKIVNRGKLVME